jgi:hypothetical protein
MHVRSAGSLTSLALCIALAGCEVIVDFDRDKLDDQRTLGPTPLPNADGAIAVVPDAARADGALIGPDEEDAGALDAALLDAALADAGDGASESADAAGIDAATGDVGTDGLDASLIVTASR